MAFTKVQENQSTWGNLFGDSTETVTFGQSVTSGNLVVVVCLTQNTLRSFAVTNTANITYSQAVNSNGAMGRATIFYGVASSGFTGVTITTSGTNSDNSGIWIAEFSGNSASQTPVTNGATTSAATSHSTGSVTPGVAVNLVIAGMVGTSGTYTLDSGFTNVDITGAGGNCVAGWLAQTANTAQSWDATTDAGENCALAIASFQGADTAVTVTSVSSGATFENGETSITITGTGFGASQGNGTVKISPTDSVGNAAAVSQTVTAWSNTSLTITAVKGDLAYNTGMYLFVTTDGAASNTSGYSVQFVLNPILLVRTWN